MRMVISMRNRMRISMRIGIRTRMRKIILIMIG
jgi:hypothetical protein